MNKKGESLQDCAVDVSDMLDFGGPSFEQATMRIGMTTLL
jgi:hypothetical protein